MTNQYVKYQRQLGVCVIYVTIIPAAENLAPCETALLHILLPHQSLIPDRLYSHIVQHKKQSRHLNAAVQIVDREGCQKSPQLMEWPPPLSLPAPNKTLCQSLPTTRGHPYRIPIQQPTTPASCWMTRRHCTEFINGIKANREREGDGYRRS